MESSRQSLPVRTVRWFWGGFRHPALRQSAWDDLLAISEYAIEQLEIECCQGYSPTRALLAAPITVGRKVQNSDPGGGCCRCA